MCNARCAMCTMHTARQKNDKKMNAVHLLLRLITHNNASVHRLFVLILLAVSECLFFSIMCMAQ